MLKVLWLVVVLRLLVVVDGEGRGGGVVDVEGVVVSGGGVVVVVGGSGVVVSGCCGSVLFSVDDFIVCVCSLVLFLSGFIDVLLSLAELLMRLSLLLLLPIIRFVIAQILLIMVQFFFS